jgi:hypothetical protein
MRFGSHEKHTIGETKTVVKFALFPKKIGDVWIWLEKYKVQMFYANVLGSNCWVEDKKELY